MKITDKVSIYNTRYNQVNNKHSNKNIYSQTLSITQDSFIKNNFNSKINKTSEISFGGYSNQLLNNIDKNFPNLIKSFPNCEKFIKDLKMENFEIYKFNEEMPLIFPNNFSGVKANIKKVVGSMRYDFSKYENGKKIQTLRFDGDQDAVEIYDYALNKNGLPDLRKLRAYSNSFWNKVRLFEPLDFNMSEYSNNHTIYYLKTERLDFYTIKDDDKLSIIGTNKLDDKTFEDFSFKLKNGKTETSYKINSKPHELTKERLDEITKELPEDFVETLNIILKS